MPRAACRGQIVDYWFDEGGSGLETARAVCTRCTVKSDCFEYALTNEIVHGIWGGATPRQRIIEKRRRARIADFVSTSGIDVAS